MKDFFAFLASVSLLSSFSFAQDGVPTAVQRVLRQIPKIKEGDTLSSFLSAAAINDVADCIDGVGGHKSYFLTWSIEDSGHWLMWTNSRQVLKDPKDPSERQWATQRDAGELVSVAIYYRADVTKSLDFSRAQRQFPYLSGRMLHTKSEAEQE